MRTPVRASTSRAIDSVPLPRDLHPQGGTDDAPKSLGNRRFVLVTGRITGYVAEYCIAQFLNDGWRVRTTVES